MSACLALEESTPGPGEFSHANSWEQIAAEHNYPRLMAQWSSAPKSLPTCRLFAPQTDEDDEGEDDDIEMIDVQRIPPTVDLPYDCRKVAGVMNECAHHMNLVCALSENPEAELERVLAECTYSQQVLLSRLFKVLEGDLLSRLAHSESAHEIIKRRLGCDRAAKQFRKALVDVKWDPQLTQWVHRTLLRVLDVDMLPIYLDILQVLKAKCPVLVEQMIHSNVTGEGSSEALHLLLKRPWNPVLGLPQMDKQVRFDPAPLFIILPHTITALGGRRWRMWHSQLSAIGKVFPVVLPESLTEVGQEASLRDCAEQMVLCSLARVQELKEQYPTRPVILLSWSVGGRIACKVAEVEKVSCIVSLGLPSQGLDHKWKVSTDLLVNCTVPTVFVVGEHGRVTSIEYLEKLRERMKTPTSLVVVSQGDDLLRLKVKIKEELLITQSIVDRCIQEKIYEFLVHILPCSLPVDVRQVRKRRIHSEENSGSFLSQSLPNSSIVLSAPPPGEDKNSNLNNNSLFRNLLAARGITMGHSSSSPAGLTANKQLTALGGFPLAKVPAYELPRIGRPPKLGRPRSKSAVADVKKKPFLPSTGQRSRSKSGDSSPLVMAGGELVSLLPADPLQQASPISSSSLLSSGNSNNNNSSETSPSSLLSAAQASFRPMPITPPKNPYEDPKQISDPRTLKQLHLQ